MVEAWVARRAPQRIAATGTAVGFLSERVYEVATRAARGYARPLLAFPTHVGGWLDPAVRDQRRGEFGRLRNRPDEHDALQASIRSLFPADEPVALEPSISVPSEKERRRTIEQQFKRIFPGHQLGRIVDAELARTAEQPSPRTVVGGSTAALGRLAGSVEALATPRPASHLWWTGNLRPWAALDPLTARWLTTIVPWCPELAFAGAAEAAWDALDRESSQEHADLLLAHGAEPDVAIGPIGWFAVATALLGKAPGLRRAGADVLEAAISDGRADPEALGRALAAVLGAGKGVAGRLDRSLRDLGRISTLHAAQTARVVDALLAGLPVTPRGFHGVLELRLELGASLGDLPVRGEARAALERTAEEASTSSKLGRAARSLLAVDREGAAVGTARAMAFEALLAQEARLPGTDGRRTDGGRPPSVSA